MNILFCTSLTFTSLRWIYTEKKQQDKRISKRYHVNEIPPSEKIIQNTSSLVSFYFVFVGVLCSNHLQVAVPAKRKNKFLTSNNCINTAATPNKCKSKMSSFIFSFQYRKKGALLVVLCSWCTHQNPHKTVSHEHKCNE